MPCTPSLKIEMQDSSIEGLHVPIYTCKLEFNITKLTCQAQLVPGKVLFRQTNIDGYKFKAADLN